MTGAALTATFLSAAISGHAITVRRPGRVALTLAVTSAAWLALALSRAAGTSDGSALTAAAIAVLAVLGAALWSAVAWLNTHPPVFAPVSAHHRVAGDTGRDIAGPLTGSCPARHLPRRPAAARLTESQPIPANPIGATP